MTVTRTRYLVFAVCAALACAAPAAAQQHVPDTGGRVYGIVGGTFGEGTFLTSGGGAGLRLTRHIGIDVELTHFSGESDRDWDDGIAFGRFGIAEDYPPAGVRHAPPLRGLSLYPEGDRSATALLTKFTVEFPVAGERLFPYITAGGGVGRVTDELGGVFASPLFPFDGGWLASAVSTSSDGDADDDVPEGGHADWDGDFLDLEIPAGPWLEEHKQTGLTLVVGGGIDVRLWRGLAVGAEVRWLRVLLNREDFDAAQVVSRVSYRF